MQAIARSVSQKAPFRQPSTTITTTLYDLLEAIHDEVPPGHRGERLATEVVAHLLDSGRIRFIGDRHHLDAFSSNV
jgi:hypothetical protein